MPSRARPFAAVAVGLVALAAFALAAGSSLSQVGSAADRLAQAAFATSMGFAFVAIAGALLTTQKLGVALGLGRGRLSLPDLSLLVLGGLALSHLLELLITATGVAEGSAMLELAASIEGARGMTLLAVVVGTGSAGIGEELLCRGLIQRGVQRHFGAAAGLLVASLLFATLHADLVHSSFALVIGFYLGALLLVTGSIRVCVTLHVLNNVVASAGAAYASDLGDPPVVVTGAAIVAVAVALRILAREFKSAALGSTSPAPSQDPDFT